MRHSFARVQNARLFQSFPAPTTGAATDQPTELPDSLEDAAQIAAQACSELIEGQGAPDRCRIDYDTSAGDETVPLLRRSAEFMRNLVSSLVYLQMPKLHQERQAEVLKAFTAQQELRRLERELQEDLTNDNGKDQADRDEKESTTESSIEDGRKQELEGKIQEMEEIIALNGRDAEYEYKGPIARIYFPDEAKAELYKKDWLNTENPGPALVPPCVEFSCSDDFQSQDLSNDKLVFFFCPNASDYESLKAVLQTTKDSSPCFQLAVFVNPNLDAGRKGLTDLLPHAYYLRSLQWGALARVWPRDFSVYEISKGRFQLIQTLQELPSTQELEDIHCYQGGS